jgi:ABC-type sugar transport system ATPase subunit
MNILEGDTDNSTVTGDGFRVALPAGIQMPTGRVAVGIRPEDLQHDASADATLRGTVRTVEYLGARSLLRMNAGDKLIAAFLPSSVELSPGAPVGLSPSTPDKLRFFDLQSGQAVRT